jgi:hypothetical protein
MASELSAVRNGTYLGECFVHCNEEVSVSATEVRYDLTSPAPDPSNPDIHASEPFPPARWAAIADAAGSAALDELPSAIGHVDTADAGGEFIEVIGNGDVKRVDFGMGADVPQASPLLGLLRGLRSELASRHRP